MAGKDPFVGPPWPPPKVQTGNFHWLTFTFFILGGVWAYTKFTEKDVKVEPGYKWKLNEFRGGREDDNPAWPEYN